MVDWILDRLGETSADEVHLVTNARFAERFERWAEDKDVRIHNDGTTSNEDRLGASPREGIARVHQHGHVKKNPSPRVVRGPGDAAASIQGT